MVKVAVEVLYIVQRGKGFGFIPLLLDMGFHGGINDFSLFFGQAVLGD